MPSTNCGRRIEAQQKKQGRLKKVHHTTGQTAKEIRTAYDERRVETELITVLASHGPWKLTS